MVAGTRGPAGPLRPLLLLLLLPLLGAAGATSSSRNAVEEENALRGTPEVDWDVNGAGDLGIQGFARAQAFGPGDRAEFAVRTEAAKWRGDVYRLGYYSGDGARKVATLRPLPGHESSSNLDAPCRHEPDTLLFDCGNWETSLAWDVPANATSGLHFVRLVREDVGAGAGGWREDAAEDLVLKAFQPAWKPPRKLLAGEQPARGRQASGAPVPDPSWPHAYGANRAWNRRRMEEPHASHVWFVVRPPPDRRPDIWFVTADSTWQAYNRWGGASLYSGRGGGHGVKDYLHSGDGLAEEDPVRRAFKASYNRPLVTRDYRAINMPLGCEYPAIRFFERLGYDIGYVSQYDVDTGGVELLRRASVVFSTGHDEYWSGPHRAALEAACDAGVHLMFMSGNEGYWRTRWEDAGRTLVCYKDSQEDAKHDPAAGEWTGTWRDARPINPLGAQPENALIGQIFTVNAWRNDVLEVPRPLSGLRMWRETPVAAAGRRSPEPARLLRGVMGHEWDEPLDNGVQPPGLVLFSSTTVDGVLYIQDYGATFDTGTATHALSLYRAASGALVFGAGTVQWSWGLDGHHDGSRPELANPYSTRLEVDVEAPDRSVQQLTVNLLADMGVAGGGAALAREGLVQTHASADGAPPACELETSANEGSVAVRARDAEGRVGAVELARAGGRFRRARRLDGAPGPDGWERWGLEAEVEAGAATRILCRVTDDSLNTATVELGKKGPAPGSGGEL